MPELHEMNEQQLRADFAIRRRIERHSIVRSVAMALPFMALPLVKFTAVPVVGWMVYVVGVAACAVLMARTIDWFRDEDPRIRKVGTLTMVGCAAAPIVSLLGILFIQP